MIEDRRIRRAHLIGQRANALQARLIVRLAEIHGSADLGVHLSPRPIPPRRFSARSPLAPARARKKQPGPFGHQNVVAHHRQVGAARHAHPHDRGDLRNAHGAHHRVIAENPAEIVRVRKHILLQRQKHSGGIDQVNRRNAIVDGDILRANHFFCGHREKRAGLYGRVIGDNHEHAPRYTPQPGDGSRRRSAAPLLIHLVSRVNAELEKMGAGIDQCGYPLARGKPVFLVLRFDRFCAAAFADFFFLILQRGEQFHHLSGIFLKLRRFQVERGFQSRHAVTSAQEFMTRKYTYQRRKESKAIGRWHESPFEPARTYPHRRSLRRIRRGGALL